MPERVLPAAVLAAPTPTPQEAVTELVRRAARSHGVASGACLADYYRLRLQPAPGQAERQGRDRRARRVRRADPGGGAGLEAAGLPPPRRPAAAAGRPPARCSARSTRWCGSGRGPRPSSTSSTGSRSTSPPRSGVHGYYVLPFLLGDRLVGRVDLKADRATGRLLVQGAFAEAGAPPETAEELAAELRRLADWLGPGRRRGGRARRPVATHWETRWRGRYSYHSCLPSSTSSSASARARSSASSSPSPRPSTPSRTTSSR